MITTTQEDAMAEALPIPDYDHLPVGSLQHRIRSLDGTELDTLLAYELGHNDRPQVIEILRHRIGELRQGATPSPGKQDDNPVEAEGTRSGSPVGPEGAAGSGEPSRHGVQGFRGEPPA